MSKYPEIYPGRRLTASLLDNMLPEVVVKSTNTDRASFTTLTIDPDLQFEAEGNAQYLIEFYLMAAAILLADFKTEWTTPADATGLKSVMGPGSAASDSNADNIAVRLGVHQFATDMTYSGVRNGAELGFFVLEWGVVTTISSGTIGLNWCQATSNATATRVFGGSFLRATRLA